MENHRRARVTRAEYDALSEARQKAVKNGAGFVGGKFAGGKRKRKNIEFRSLVTLDIDLATFEAWEDFKITYGFAACVYSTFSHTPEKPKLRLVMPLDRDVSDIEYEPIARKVAQWWGIDQMDATTYQSARLMFWPSCPSDALPFYELHEGPWLCADDILAEYDDWLNAAEYPYSDKERERRNTKGGKLADPREKPLATPVGVFCRLWTVPDAIDRFLSDKYTLCDATGNDVRYTHEGGSTKAGLVIYGADSDGEPIYAFSNHSTDPVTLLGGGNGGSEVNAFDLVRIHLFGDLDDDKKEGTRSDRTKSYQAMQDFLIKDGDYRLALRREMKEAQAEKLAGAKSDFTDGLDMGDSDDAGVSGEEDDTWEAMLDVDKHGMCKNTIQNAKLLLENLPELRGLFGYNEFDNTVMLLRRPVWEPAASEEGEWRPRTFEGADMAALRLELERHGIGMKEKIADAFCIVYMQQKYNPVREHFSECAERWDGVRRNGGLLQEWLEAEDSELTREVMRKTLIGMVKRVMEPGCKFDTSLALVGGEGAGKSLFLSRICLRKHEKGLNVFNDSFTYDMIGSKEAIEQVVGSLGVECGEMVGFDRKEVGAVKHFLTIQTDKVRLPWGEGTRQYNRQCVFFNTGNRVDFLRGNDGNRRYWVVELSTDMSEEARRHRRALANRIHDEFKGEIIDQIIGEAVCDYMMGEQPILDIELELEAHKMQMEHAEASPIIDGLAGYLDTLLPVEWSRRSKAERMGYFAQMADSLQERGVAARQTVSFTEWWLEGCQKGNVQPRHSDREAFRSGCKQLGWVERAGKGPHRAGVYGPQRITFDRKQAEELM